MHTCPVLESDSRRGDPTVALPLGAGGHLPNLGILLVVTSLRVVFVFCTRGVLPTCIVILVFLVAALLFLLLVLVSSRFVGAGFSLIRDLA